MITAIDEIVNLLGSDFKKCESPSLRLEKFVHLTKGNKTERDGEIKAFVSCHNIFAKKNAPAAFRHPKAEEMVATLGANLIVNQSGGVLENAGLCLDPIRNYPYIPGSAVKGIASHAAWMEWKDDPTLEMASRIADVFGFPTNHADLDKFILKNSGSEKPQTTSGSVCFMAAVPWKDATISTDIATTHHPNYYQGKQPKAFDNEDPIPLPFPVVKAGSKFVFRLLPLKKCNEAIMADARHWLELAMTVCGMGAKTAAGYGWFDYDEEKSQADLKEQREKAERERIAKEKEEQERIASEKARKEAEEKANAKKELAKIMETMTPDEQWDYKIANIWDEKMFRNRLGMFWQTGKNAPDNEEKKAIVRALKNSRRAIWDEIKACTRPRKGEPAWPRIVQEIRVLNKQIYGDKMP